MITLTAPDGQTSTVPTNFGPGPVTLNNAPFVVVGLGGGPVDGNYTLTIDDTASNNTGTLTGWSVTIASELPTLGLQTAPGRPERRRHAPTRTR